MSCGVGHRHSLELMLLWLRRRLVSLALIGPLAWEPPYAMGVAQKSTHTKKEDISDLALPKARHISALC